MCVEVERTKLVTVQKGNLGDVAQLVRALPSNRTTEPKALSSLVSSLVSILLRFSEKEERLECLLPALAAHFSTHPNTRIA